MKSFQDVFTENQFIEICIEPRKNEQDYDLFFEKSLAEKKQILDFFKDKVVIFAILDSQDKSLRKIGGNTINHFFQTIDGEIISGTSRVEKGCQMPEEQRLLPLIAYLMGKGSLEKMQAYITRKEI